MSLILDALKKSEAERQRGQLPNLLSPLPSTPSHALTNKKSGLPMLAVIALLIAALVAGYFYLKKEDAQSAVLASTPVDTRPIQTSVPAAVHNELPSTPAITTPAPVVVEKPPVPVADDEPAAMQTPPEPAPPQTSEPIAEPEARIAGIAEMPVEQRQQLPALKLSMHVYSSEQAKRFAIIDGQRVNEGSVLGTAVVEKIRQDGVVLSVQGQSYLLPRP